MRNLSERSTINKLPDIIRCKKCNKYNNVQSKNVVSCTFCGNPISSK